MKRWPTPLTILMTVWIVTTTFASAEEATDVTFSTKYASGRPKTADFYYEGHAVGRGREGFKFIVDKISDLPFGSSIVWGPNYARCGSCSGAEPRCVPKYLYPDLWAELELHVKNRKLSLSSNYPGPRPLTIASRETNFFPTKVFEDQAPAGEKFDAVLDWEVGKQIGRGREQPEKTIRDQGRWHRYTSSGVTLEDHYDVNLFLSRLSENSQLLVQIQLNKEVDTSVEGDTPSTLSEDIRSIWRDRFANALRRRRVVTVVAVPSVLLQSLKKNDETLQIRWQNYHGPESLPGGIVYLMNGQFVGMGDRGIDQILVRLSKLPRGAKVELPRYEYSGRWALESFSEEELERKNEALRELVPFMNRKNEFDKSVAERNLGLVFDSMSPGLDAQTVLDWDAGDRSGKSFVTTGRIVRHDEQPTQPALRLSWSGYETQQNRKDEESRAVESQAFYSLDDIKQGRGVTGFAKAMEKLASLPEKSVVHVKICIRTKPPFTCPITWEGQRHFERTGFEPYFGLFPWLIDVAQKRKLLIEWIPDEERTCADCELNK